MKAIAYIAIGLWVLIVTAALYQQALVNERQLEIDNTIAQQLDVLTNSVSQITLMTTPQIPGIHL